MVNPNPWLCCVDRAQLGCSIAHRAEPPPILEKIHLSVKVRKQRSFVDPHLAQLLPNLGFENHEASKKGLRRKLFDLEKVAGWWKVKIHTASARGAIHLAAMDGEGPCLSQYSWIEAVRSHRNRRAKPPDNFYRDCVLLHCNSRGK